MLILTEQQKKVITLMEGSGNVFLTGGAGTGKSFVVQEFLKNFPETPVLASTGAAALIIGGRTFHSFFGLGILEGGAARTVERALKNAKVVRRLKKAKTLIIDEVSMLSGTTLFAAEQIARLARNSTSPWGGIQIIMVGDFAQLPPVTRNGEATDWAFLSQTWYETDLQTVELSEFHRTTEPEFLEVLQYVRNGNCNPVVHKFLNSRKTEVFEDFSGTRLFPHRATAEEFNLKKLASLEGNAIDIPTQFSGVETSIEVLKKQAPIPEILTLKKNALVMLRKNDPEGKYINGSLAYVNSITTDAISLTLMDHGGRISLKPMTFSLMDGDGKILASATNFPLSLAYATTIHKSQGATLDRLFVNLRGLWEAGQAYVALSRVRESKNLFLGDWDVRSIRVSPEVKQFYESLSNQDF